MKVGRCSAVTRKGQPCPTSAVPGDTFCWFHSAQTAQERRAAASRGGKARSNGERAKRQLAAGALTRPEVEGLVGRVMVGVVKGSVQPGVAHAVAALAKVALAIQEANVLDQVQADVADLKAALNQQRGAA